MSARPEDGVYIVETARRRILTERVRYRIRAANPAEALARYTEDPDGFAFTTGIEITEAPALTERGAGFEYVTSITPAPPATTPERS